MLVHSQNLFGKPALCLPPAAPPHPRPCREEAGPEAALFLCPPLHGCPRGFWDPVRRNRASLGEVQGTQ